MNKKFINIITLLLLMNTVNSFAQNQNNLQQEVNNKPSTKKVISLNTEKESDWTLYYGVQDKNAPQTPDELKKSNFKYINAKVPGNVEIDLEREGIIKDPMVGTQVYELRKYETYAWWYSRTFDAPKVKIGDLAVAVRKEGLKYACGGINISFLAQ